jgi:hypothetical protein
MCLCKLFEINLIFLFVQLIDIVGSDFSCQSCLDSLNTAHQVKEIFLKNQELLVQNGKLNQLVTDTDVLIKEEEPELEMEELEQNEDDFDADSQEKELETTTNSRKRKSSKRQMNRTNK